MSKEQDNTSAAQGKSITELLRQLATSSAAVIQDEIALFKQEARERLSVILSGVAMAVIGIVLSVVSLLLFAAAVAMSLVPSLGTVNATLATGCLFGVISGIFTFLGYLNLKRIP